METVEIVIRIPKREIEGIKRYCKRTEIKTSSLEDYIYRSIANGTVLPKGHGDLKDMNDLCYKSRYGCKGNCDYLHTCDLYDAPTVIEADKAESEDKK